MTVLAFQGVQVPQRTRPHRITFDVDSDLYAWLGQARVQDRLSTADRIRAALELCRTDTEFAAQVITKATELAQERAST